MREVVATYATPNGENALTVTRENNGRFSYMGKYGAGCGHDEAAMKSTVETIKRHHKRMVHVDGINFLI